MNDPTQFGRYLAKELIGRGGMGTVYLGEDPVIGRRVAIKVVRASPHPGDPEGAEIQARFEREFRVAGTLSHPNIVTIYDVGQEGDSSFIAMEHIEGESLAELLASGYLHSFGEISELARQICSALDYAHAQGVVHRDIKPANILFTRTGVAKITDFGIAKLASSEMTRTGTLLGTPWYMSPEQVAGSSVSGASDQFSVGVILYQLLTGERPFSGDNPTTVLYKIVHESPAAPQSVNARLPEPINGVLLKALDKDPAERYEDCSSFASALRDALRELADSETAPDWDTDDDAEPTVALGSAESRVGPAAAKSVPPGRELGSGDTTVAESTTYSRLPGRSYWIAISATLAAVALAAMAVLLWTRGAQVSFIPVAPPPRPSLQKLQVHHTLHVGTQVAGAEIWVDGEDRGLEPPAEVVLEGEPGQLVHLALMIDGEAVAETELVLGDGTPLEWSPEVKPEPPPTAEPKPARRASAPPAARPPAPQPASTASRQTFRIHSRPAGARVLVDGAPTEKVTPAEVELAAGETLRLELDGYRSIERVIDPDRLTATELEGRTLAFELLPTSPPGRLDPEARTVQAGAQVEMPRLIHKEEPEYPQAARNAGLAGLVILEVILDPRGLVAECDVLRGLDPRLDRAAVLAVLARRYEPTTYRRKPVNVRMTVTVAFPPDPAQP